MLLLELKTKSSNVEHLLDLPHGGKTVISWSVNPETIVETSRTQNSATERTAWSSRKGLSAAGYKVAFHFDPMIHYPDWEKGYQELVEQILDAVPS